MGPSLSLQQQYEIDRALLSIPYGVFHSPLDTLQFYILWKKSQELGCCNLVSEMLVQGHIQVTNILDTVYEIGDIGVRCFLYLREQGEIISASYEANLLFLQNSRIFHMPPSSIYPAIKQHLHDRDVPVQWIETL